MGLGADSPMRRTTSAAEMLAPDAGAAHTAYKHAFVQVRKTPQVRMTAAGAHVEPKPTRARQAGIEAHRPDASLTTLTTVGKQC